MHVCVCACVCEYERVHECVEYTHFLLAVIPSHNIIALPSYL